MMKVQHLAYVLFFCSLQGHTNQTAVITPSDLAPYNLKWGMSYDDARNIPLYSLEVSDINYAGKDPNLIIATVEPTEINASDYQEVKLYFNKNKGLQSVVVNALVDVSSTSNDKDDGKEALALYNKEATKLNHTYGKPINQQEFISNKKEFYGSLAQCIKMQEERYMKGLDSDNIPGCSKWQRDYKKGNVTVLLTIEPRQITKQYIYKTK